MRKEVKGTGSCVHSISQKQERVCKVTHRLRANAQTKKVRKEKIVFLRAFLRNSGSGNKKFMEQKHGEKLQKNRVLESHY